MMVGEPLKEGRGSQALAAAHWRTADETEQDTRLHTP